jgi:hypothetical protein
MAVAVAKEEMDYTIKPEAGASTISTSEWPLLLKNYDKRTFCILPISSQRLIDIVALNEALFRFKE